MSSTKYAYSCIPIKNEITLNPNTGVCVLCMSEYYIACEYCYSIASEYIIPDYN